MTISPEELAKECVERILEKRKPDFGRPWPIDLIPIYPGKAEDIITYTIKKVIERARTEGWNACVDIVNTCVKKEILE